MQWLSLFNENLNTKRSVGTREGNKKPRKIQIVWHGFANFLKLSGFSNSICWTFYLPLVGTPANDVFAYYTPFK